MKCGMRMAGAVGIGYVLGRTRKMKFALMLAGVGLSGRGGPQALLERTTSALGSTPELAKITETVRGELLDAARGAAVTAASNRIDALNARLQQHGDLGDAIPDEDTGDEDDRAGEEDEPDHEDREDPETAAPAPKRSTSPRTRSAASRGRTGERRVRTPARAAAAATPRRRADTGESATENAPVRRTRR